MSQQPPDRRDARIWNRARAFWPWLLVLLGLLLAITLVVLLPAGGGPRPETAMALSPTAPLAPTPSPTALPSPTPAPAATPPPTPEPPPTATALPSPLPPEASETSPAAIPVYGYRVVNVYPHDPGAFTQGLVYEDGFLYEGTGMWGQSSIRRVELETGQVLQIQPLDAQYFGEGITIWADHIVQLTWQKNTGFVYDKATFAQLDTFQYPTEGWGITHDASKLIMSDGTARLHFWDPDTFSEIGYVDVVAAGLPVTRLNELEYIDGLVYANVWQTDRIAIIDPASGAVTAWIDLTGLLPPEDRTPTTDVLNGIAYDAAGRRLFVTGKYWPKLFEIKLVGPYSAFLPRIQKQIPALSAQAIDPKPD